MGLIDISVPLDSNTPVWPGSPGFSLYWIKRLNQGDNCNNSRLGCDIHIGTHIDAPLHFVENGHSIDQLDINTLVGKCWVADLTHVHAVAADDLEMVKVPEGFNRILIKTQNSALWSKANSGFYQDFVALLPDAAKWIVDRGIRTIGIDYLSIQRFQDPPLVHQILLQAGVVIVEGLNLTAVEQGEYELICLPLKIKGAEGAPARAILRTIDKKAIV